MNNKKEFFINNFDLLRLFASLQVVMAHGYHHLNVNYFSEFVSLLSYFPGVPIFFVISGYLISSAYERNPNLFDYARNRILRIFPALWVCFIISILSFLFIYDFDVDVGNFLLWCFFQLSVFQFYNPEFLREYGVGVLNGSLWTIPIELQFYVLVPFVFYFLRTLKVGYFLIFLLFVLVNQLYVSVIYDMDSFAAKIFGVSIFPYFYMFLIGFFLYKKRSFFNRYIVGNAHYFFLLYVFVSFVLGQAGFTVKGSYMNPVSIVFLALFVISFAYSYTERISSLTGGVDISYGIYIYHMVVINFLVHVDFFSSDLNFIVMFIVTIILSLLSWFIIEKPALRLKHRLKFNYIKR